MKILKESFKYRNNLVFYLRSHSEFIEGLNVMDLIILDAIQDDGFSISQFSKEYIVDRTYISKRLRFLESNKLISRDNREFFLTEKGGRVNLIIKEEREGFHNYLNEKHSPEDLETAYRVLSTMNGYL